jgi:hypothetical protein
MRGRLHTGELVAGAAALLLAVVMFLGWYEPTDLFGDTGVSFSAWQSFSVIDVILGLTILAAFALVGLTLTQRTAALPVTAAVIVTALGFLATLLVLFRVLIDQPGFGAGVPDVAIDNTIWAWVGLLCCLGILYGGYLTLRDESSRAADPQGPPAT